MNVLHLQLSYHLQFEQYSTIGCGFKSSPVQMRKKYKKMGLNLSFIKRFNQNTYKFGSTFSKRWILKVDGFAYPKTSPMPNCNTMFFNTIYMSFCSVTLILINSIFFNQFRMFFT